MEQSEPALWIIDRGSAEKHGSGTANRGGRSNICLFRPCCRGGGVGFGGVEQRPEEGVRPVRPRAELWVKLGADHEGMVAELAELDEGAVGRGAAGNEAELLE